MPKENPRKLTQFRKNLRLARRLWPQEVSVSLTEGLRTLSTAYRLSIAAGDLQFLDGKWYVTHTGLLGLAHRNRCSGIRVQPAHQFCDPAANRWVFKATVYKRPGSKGFVGYGDADQNVVSSRGPGFSYERNGDNRRLTEFQGVLLLTQLARLEEQARRREQNPQGRLSKTTVERNPRRHPAAYL